MKYKLYIIALLLFFVGCVKDPDVEPYAESEGEIFTLSIEPFSDKTTRATRSTSDEKLIKRGYIIFYYNDGTYKGYKNITDLNLSQDESIVSFEASGEFSNTDKIIAVFNHDETATIPTNFNVVTAENINEYFPISSSYLSKVEDDANDGTYSLGMPMYVNDFTDSDRAVREVYRSVARMELFIKDDLTIEHDSHTHSIGTANLDFVLVNAASQGSTVVGSSPSSYVEDCFDIDNFDGNFPHSLTEYSSNATDTNNKIYLQSFPYSNRSIKGTTLKADKDNAERFAIILRHKDKDISTGTEVDVSRYYKLNLLDKATSTYFDVEPNHSYRILIKAINSRGYETLKEAYEMPPSNIEYEIYDDKGGFTYSNGQYAISMDEILSYDEVLVYGSNKTTLEFNNIRYVLPHDNQMDGANFDTNEVVFSILKNNNADKLTIETTSDFVFDSDNKSVLTDEGQSISVTLSGEGECSIALRIKLGNLEMGREEITIKKVATNGEGNGAFDAHPNHFEIAGQEFINGTWQSDDLDFGARASSVAYDDCGDGGTVIYMDENATPTGYRTMDGYISGEHSINSYPVFSPKTRKGYYSYKDSMGETKKVMIQLEQLAPFYLGHFGSTQTDATSLYHYKGLVCEKIEEIPSTDYRGGVMEWSKKYKEYYSDQKTDYWDDYLGLGERYRNLVDGLHITTQIVKRNNFDKDSEPTAAQYCYMKNDINGDGVVDDMGDEPIRWYLPAQNQMLAMWINMNVFDTDDDLYRLHNIEYVNDGCPYYWTSSEVDDVETSELQSIKPTDFSSYALRFNLQSGQTYFGDKTPDWTKSHIRCVRELD